MASSCSSPLFGSLGIEPKRSSLYQVSANDLGLNQHALLGFRLIPQGRNRTCIFPVEWCTAAYATWENNSIQSHKLASKKKSPKGQSRKLSLPSYFSISDSDPYELIIDELTRLQGFLYSKTQ
jgi:hypothetical protein